MENSPLKPEDDADDKTSAKESAKKKTKKATALGGFAIEPKKSVAKEESAEDIWQKLTLTKRKGGQSETAVPLAELDQAVIRQAPEASEAEAPLEALSPAEEQFAEQEIVTARQAAAAEQPAEDSETAAAEAVALFHDKIVKEGQPPEQAYTEILQSLGVEPEPVAAAPETTEEVIADSAESPVSRLRALFTSVAPAEDRPHAADNSEVQPLAVVSAPTTPLTEASKATKEYIPYYNDDEVISAALIGGLIGYFIGRRRGRIKTRKKLLPIQKKLEKQVGKLEEDIQQKEFYIRKAARNQTRDRQRIFQMEQAHQKTEQNRPVALEASQLHGKKVAPENIGRVLMTADEEKAVKPDTPEKRPEKAGQTTASNKRVETLSRRELLELSEKVAVENTTLRQVYETHLVTEQGLRRLVNEYIHGGDVQKALRAELVEHEIDFERDPFLRDHDRSQPSAATDSSPTLSSLLQKAGVSSDHEKDDEFTRRAEKLYNSDQQAQQHRHRRFMDLSLIIIIFILLLLVLTLVLGRR